MEEMKEFDCFEDGCGKCEVCEYLNFRETAENCAPSGSTIERNEKIERYLKRKDEEINLAVSKERERIVEEIEKLSSYWRHPMALFPKERTTQEELKEMKVKEDIINLINTKA